MKVLIIGNVAITGEFGSRIDSDEFDQVIRMNHYKLDGFRNQIGERVDIHALQAVDRCMRYMHFAPVIWMLSLTSAEKYWNDRTGVRRKQEWAGKFRNLFVNEGGVYTHIPQVRWGEDTAFLEVHEKLKNRFPEGQINTTGLILIESVHLKWPDAEIHLLGFDGCKTGHYYRAAHPHNLTKHNSELEREILVGWKEQGKIRFLEDSSGI